MIHLAVHGMADKQFPDRAALALGTSPTSQEDGLELEARKMLVNLAEHAAKSLHG